MLTKNEIFAINFTATRELHKRLEAAGLTSYYSTGDYAKPFADIAIARAEEQGSDAANAFIMLVELIAEIPAETLQDISSSLEAEAAAESAAEAKPAARTNTSSQAFHAVNK